MHKWFFFIQGRFFVFVLNYLRVDNIIVDLQLFLSSHELKVQVSFSDLVVCLSVHLSVCLKTFYIFIFFKISRTNWLISTKLGTKHSWVNGIQVCSNEGRQLFPRGDNNALMKIKNLLDLKPRANFNQT